MYIRTLLAAGLAGVVCYMPVAAQVSRDDLKNMSSVELLAAGSTPTGDMNMQAMPWPIDELLTRERGAVTELAWNCLATPPAATYSHAFCVNLVTALAPADLDERLPALYAALDEAGRYEVLLHALRSGSAAYAASFTEIVNRLATARVLDRPALLAMVYALHVYDAALAQAIARLDSSPLQVATSAPATLDGFPYSDVVSLFVPDPVALVGEAQRFNAAYSAMLARPMNAAESALLQTYRERLGRAQAIPFGLQPGSLAATLARMSASYAWLNFTDISRTVRFSDVGTTLPDAPRTYTQVMAELCNREALDFYSDGLVDRSRRWLPLSSVRQPRTNSVR